MKTTILFLSFVLCIHSMIAQVDVRKSTQITPTSPQMILSNPDSCDITTRDAMRFIGDTVILYQNPKALYVPDYKAPLGERCYEAPLFTYFTITDFNQPQTFKLKNTENDEVCYYTHFGDGVKPVMSVKYYLSLKNKRIGSKWCIEGKDGVWEIKDFWLEEGSTAQKLQLIGDTITITMRTMWDNMRYEPHLALLDKYKEHEWVINDNGGYGKVDTIKVVMGKPYLVFKSPKGKEYSFDIVRSKESNFKNGLSIGLMPIFTKEEAQKYIKHFGQIWWKKILTGVAHIGMTAQMVELTIGKPNRIYTSETTSRYLSIWNYGYMDVVLKNGKVIEIRDN